LVTVFFLCTLHVDAPKHRRLAALSMMLVLAAGAGTTAASADASAAKAITSYCSPSGDVCFGVFKRNGKVLLQITTAARYFNRYTLCVTLLPRGNGAENARRCGAFPLLQGRASTWASTVDYAKQFIGPASHPATPLPGRYQVTWRQVCSRCTPKQQRHSASGPPLGPSLFFRLP
jgi:hypothetical protein